MTVQNNKSAVKFYTQYTKETRTKTGNVSELYIHISTPSRCRWRLRVVRLHPSQDCTQLGYYICWQKSTGKLITPLIENSVEISNEQSQRCTPPYYFEFHFDTFRTLDDTHFYHTRSAVKFYTQYMKETRTKICNFPKLLHPISTPSRCRWRLRMVSLDPSHDSTQLEYHTC